MIQIGRKNQRNDNDVTTDIADNLYSIVEYHSLQNVNMNETDKMN